MSFLRRKSRHLSEQIDDSFVISDSDDEEGTAAGRTQYNFDLTHRDTRVIGDSDTESEMSKNRDSIGNSDKNKTSNSDKSETLDSEDEDLQFMNQSQRVSIIVNSSEESESEPEEEKVKSSKFKRRSIYENLPKSESEDDSEEEKFNSNNKFKRRSIYNNLTPTSISTPNNIRKRPKRAVLYSDSESEGLADVHTKTPLVTKNQKHVIESIDKDENNDTHFEENSNDSKSNEMEISDGSNYQECSNNSDAFDREKERHKQLNDDIMSDKLKISKATDKNTHSNVKSVFANNKSKLQYSNMDSDSELEISETSTDSFNRVGTGNDSKVRNPLREKKLNARNVVDLTHDSIHDNSTKQIDISKGKENIVDLTMNKSRNSSVNSSINKSLQKEEKSSAEEIIISSSASASETEIDQEALALARKEIGVGNIDFLEAQKKEHLLLSIENTQQQLDKLNKFAASVDINKLPDKGVKVHETIKAQEEKLKSLKLKLAKLPGKNTMNTPRKVQTPKTKTQPQPKVKKERSFISPLVDITISVKKEPKMEQDLKFSKQFDEFDVHDIPDVPQTSFDTADLGKKALATLNKQQSLTHHRLEQLLGSLTSRPTEDQKEKDPSGLKVQLMGHQQHALAWMKWREKQKPKGGILADDMGLGKTLTMISLILATVDQRANDSDESSSSDDGWLSRNKHKRYYGGTLVVCPASLIKQWEAEVKNRVKKGLLSVLVFHGNNRSMEDRKLSKYNIVVTTYQILVREADAETGMYKMEWNRIILDEAHYIRNHKSKACIAVTGLNAKHRWALTGTPIQNKEMDLYAILKFLKCSPFDDLQVWKRWVDNKNDAGKQRLITIMKSMMLRRTKQELHSKGNLDSLPEKFSELIEIEMDKEEDLVYKKILLFSQNLFAQFLAQRADKQHTKELYGGKFDRPSLSSLGSKTQFTKAQKMLLDHHSNIESHEILVLLLRLRQMCCHPALIHAMLDKQDAELNGIDNEEDANADLLNKLHNMSINEDEEIDEYVANYKIDEKVAANLLTKKNRVFNDDRQSSKVRAILKTVEKIVDKGDKVIIVSQWTSFLKVIAKHLDDIDDANYAMFTGEVPVKNRQAIVDKLNSQGDAINVLLLSLTAGGVGLNLVGANHLLLTDIHWNPQLEAQAQDRIYRFGQKKDVFIYKFICKETIEERVKNLQDKKLDIANHVLTGTRSVSSKLTIEDLKLLFS